MLQLIMVSVVMVCALGGTVGLLKLIKKISPSSDFSKNSISIK